MSQNLYLPELAEIMEVVAETPDVKTFRLRLVDEEAAQAFHPLPGQFVEVSVFGAGEAPFGVANFPQNGQSFEITVRAMGRVTSALHALGPGNLVGVRGPLGNDFLSVARSSLQKRGIPADGKPLGDLHPLLIAGGIGFPPIRSLLEFLLAHPRECPHITLLYGARTPTDRVYKKQLEAWEQEPRIHLLQTVDVGDETWQGRVGLVTELLDVITIEPERTLAFVCGPPIMIHFVTLRLLEMGLPEEHIISTLERHMKCGVGKCGHCAIGHLYVCTDGPVFSQAQLKEIQWLSGEHV